MTTRIRPALLVVALTASSLAFAGGSATAAATCADGAASGGDWPALNGGLRNTRAQMLETTIGPTEVPLLQAAWNFTPQDIGTGQLQSTPVIAEGCVYLTTSSGYAYALNADTGDLVWGNRYSETVQGVCCGGTMFAPAVEDGVVYINVSRNPSTSTTETGPFVLALDAHSGEVIWQSKQVSFENDSYTNSSAVYIEQPGDFTDLIMIGISNPEQEPNNTGGFALVDASRECNPADVEICNEPGGSGGALVERTRTIPQDQWERGMGGGSIWSTAAVDDDLYAYVGTGQPSGWFDAESEFVNATIKIDVDRSRPTFGDIVDVHKGNWDSELRGDAIPYVDVDMAASPTLYYDDDGDQMVITLQKSGWVHAAHTRHMSRAWSAPVSPYGTFLSHFSTTAADDAGNVFAHGVYPGQVISFNGTTGVPNWVAPAATVIGANPLTYANGVVWLADGKGVLNAFDSATGAVLMKRPMSIDAGEVCTNIGGGVAIARNTVYAVCGDAGVDFQYGPNDAASGYLIAYRLS